jgi:hypothetical protein
MWAAGIAAGAGLVVHWRVVGRGFLILAVAVSVVIGATGAAAGAGLWAVAASLLAAAALVGGRLAASFLATAALLWVLAGMGRGDLLGSITGALALGGVTAEMLLGHWYLVDPRLPRWALRNLGWLGLAGVGADSILTWSSLAPDPFVSPVVVAALGLTTMALLGGVLASLRVSSYTGVMAATGLSYLAVLTALGSVLVGRASMA